jgi:hypothetical protein
MRVAVVAVMLMLLSGSARATVDLAVIGKIESSGNPLAVGDGGKSIGLYQVSEIALRDYNQYHTVKVSKKELFDPMVNKRVANWIVNVRIPQMLKHFKQEVTNRNVIWAFNCGIKCVIDKRIPPVTEQYFQKYQILGGAL